MSALMKTADKRGFGMSSRPTAVSLDDDDDDTDPAILSLPAADAQASWYPTLRVTLWILSCLYSYVDVSSPIQVQDRMTLRLTPRRQQSLTISLKRLSSRVASHSQLHQNPLRPRRRTSWMGGCSSFAIC